MRDTGLATLSRAHREGWAVAAFSTYGLELTMGVVRAAEALGTPVILQAGSSTFVHAGRPALAALALQAADAATVPVGVHLDHSHDLAEIRWCAEAGYTSIMVDGSSLSFDQNVALTREAVRIGSANGVWVEGELGAIPGDEDRSVQVAAGDVTNPARAGEFVERTGVDALAVAIGNVHGMAGPQMPLDLALLERIGRIVEVPLVLHGASGLPDRQLLGAVERGVSKVNVNTELRRALLGSYQRLPTEIVKSADVVAALADAVAAVRAVATEKLVLLSRPAHMQARDQGETPPVGHPDGAAHHQGTPSEQFIHSARGHAAPQGEHHAY